MNYLQKVQIVFTVLGICSSAAVAANADQNKNSGRHQGPPPEAYTACESKAAGDTSQFTDPRGETVNGTCEQKGNELVLRPDRHSGSPGHGRQGPPPEAYTACEGKTIGDAAQFVNPGGNEVYGTCDQEGSELVLRPDRSR